MNRKVVINQKLSTKAVIYALRDNSKSINESALNIASHEREDGHRKIVCLPLSVVSAHEQMAEERSSVLWNEMVVDKLEKHVLAGDDSAKYWDSGPAPIMLSVIFALFFYLVAAVLPFVAQEVVSRLSSEKASLVPLIYFSLISCLAITYVAVRMLIYEAFFALKRPIQSFLLYFAAFILCAEVSVVFGIVIK